jgi:L-amino acid N-acyltransferase YncA
MPAFRHAAEITYFVRPDLTGKGLGSEMLARLEAREKSRELPRSLPVSHPWMKGVSASMPGTVFASAAGLSALE